MNASASALPREDEVQSKIRKIRTFGRNARVVCAALFWLPLVIIVILPLIAVIVRSGTDVGTGVVPTDIPTPNSGNGGTYDVLQALLTPLQLMVCVFLVIGVVMLVELGFHSMTASLIHRRVRWQSKHNGEKWEQRVDGLVDGIDRMQDFVELSFRTPTGWLQM